jgi:2'-5' RNA ligase/8-oxo-dGTP pyrophosphatase MutT (NUDIX family)
MTISLLSGVPVCADVEAPPVGAFDVIREDIRVMSMVRPVERIYIERLEIGYRGILFANDQPHAFVLNGNGLITKQVEDGPAIINYCAKLEAKEQTYTARLDERRADDEQNDFNDEMRERTPGDDDRAGIPEYGVEPETLINHGPMIDVIERLPDSYEQMKQGAPLSVAKENKGVCGGGVVVNKQGKLLLVKPRNGWGGYDWTFPKGYPAKADGGELTQTAVREVAEETGYRVFAKRLIGRFSHADGGVCDYFACDVDGSKPVAKFDEHETEAIRWVTVVEALELLNDDVDVRILAQANDLLPRVLIKGGDHSGTMIALFLPKEVAKTLALKGGEAPADLHITLAYLGKGLDERQKTAAASVVRRFAGAIDREIKATLGGVGRFSASVTSEDRDVVYVSVDSPQLMYARTHLVELLADVGISLKEEHGFTPHITLAYIDKTAKTPLERFEPITVKFQNVSLTIAGKSLHFKLQLSPENREWANVAKRNSQAFEQWAKTGHLEKAYVKKINAKKPKGTRNVQAPGKRGAAFWIDEKNQVRYDKKPVADQRVKGVFVHTNRMGIKFLREDSAHTFDGTRPATERYLLFWKPLGGLTHGEVHFVFDELLHSEHATMDDFVEEKIKPVWDHEKGKNKYTIEKAREWMKHVLTYLERDDAIAAGAKDLVEQDSEKVDWHAVADAARNLPSGLIPKDTTDPDQLALLRNQSNVRSALRSVLSYFGINKAPMSTDGRHNDLVVSNTDRAIGLGTAIAFHDWKGDTWMHSRVQNAFVEFCDAMVRDDGHATVTAAWGLQTLLHEELHGLSEMKGSAYRGIGAFVEEVTTEVTARMVLRERFGYLRNIDTSHTGVIRNQSNLTEPNRGGAYGDYIDATVSMVAQILASRTRAGVVDRMGVRNDAKELVEQASWMLKRKVWNVDATTPEQHVQNFVECFPTFSDAEQRQLYDVIEQHVLRPQGQNP